jgi:hypothetical protein
MVLPLAVLTVNAAAFGAYTLPRLLQERTLNSQKLALEQQASRADARLAELRERTDVMEANTRDVERFYREVVVTRKEVLLPTTREITEMAQELGLKLEGRNTKDEQVRELSLWRFEITQPLSGSYRQVVAFLDRLERSPRFLIVDKIVLTGREGGQVFLDVMLSAYYRPEEGGSRGR